jgi:hypothetical protein
LTWERAKVVELFRREGGKDGWVEDEGSLVKDDRLGISEGGGSGA